MNVHGPAGTPQGLHLGQATRQTFTRSDLVAGQGESRRQLRDYAVGFGASRLIGGGL